MILVTALVDDEHEQTGFEAGAADYIHKPIRIPIVQARVRAQLDAKSARDMLFKNNLHLRHKVANEIIPIIIIKNLMSSMTFKVFRTSKNVK